MKSAEDADKPRGRTLALAVVCALAAPFVARWLGVPSHGPSWLASYLSSTFFVLGWSCVHACTLWALGRSRAFSFTAFHIAAAASIAFVACAHFSVNLAASSTALLALMWIPVWGALAAFAIWLVFGLAIARTRAGK